MSNPHSSGSPARSLAPALAIALAFVTHPQTGAASSISVQSANVNSGLFAARIEVESACAVTVHTHLSGPIAAGTQLDPG